MSILTRFLLQRYLKNFFIVLISLELFFVGIDFLQNVKNIPDSANLQLLYLLYNSFFTLTITLPLSLIFAWIVTLVILIKNSEHVALLSVGVSKRAIYMPIVRVSLFLTVILIALQATPLAYSYDQKSKILHNQYFTNTKSDIFLKYNEYFVYFKKLYPLEKRAEKIHIYRVVDNDVKQSIVAQKAYFQNDRWYVVDAKITNKPNSVNWDTAKLDVTYEKFLHTLEGFKPKILDNVYESKSNFSIIDAVYALILLSDQGINTDKVRTILYYQILVSFFIFPVIFIVYLFASINSRFFNMTKFISFSVFSALTVWGMFFMLYKLSIGGVLIPELSIVLPIILLYLLAYLVYKYKKE